MLRRPPHRLPRRPAGGLAAGTAAALLLTACGGTDPAAAAEDDGRTTVVTSTDVWGSVVASVGGDGVDVTSVIDDPNQDPHSFEVTTRDQLLVQDADVVVQNGGGYDPFMGQLVSASGTQAPVVDAVAVSGLQDTGTTATTATTGTSGSTDAADGDHDHAEDGHEHEGHEHGALNEHVWYDLPTAGRVATAVAEALAQVDPDGAAGYRDRAQAFVDGLAPVQQAVADTAARAGGTGVATTEPVPDHLLEAMGLVLRTPEAFTSAVEAGQDVAPAVLADTEALFGDGAVAALVYNEQTAGRETEAVQAAARAAGVPVVGVTETLPEGQDYTQWMTANVEAVSAAVVP